MLIANRISFRLPKRFDSLTLVFFRVFFVFVQPIYDWCSYRLITTLSWFRRIFRVYGSLLGQPN